MDLEHVITLQVERDLEHLSDRLNDHLEDVDSATQASLQEMSADLDEYVDNLNALEARVDELEKRLTRVVATVLAALNES